MAFKMVNRIIGALACRRECFCRYRTDRHPANQAGAGGGGKGINICQFKPGSLQCLICLLYTSDAADE